MKFKSNKMLCLLLATVITATSIGVYISDTQVSASKADNKQTALINRFNEARNRARGVLSKEDDNLYDENEVIRAIVELKKKSVSEKIDSDSTNSTDGSLSEYNRGLKSKEDKVIDAQESIIKKVEKITGKKVNNRCGYLINSFTVEVKRKDISKIEQIQGVERVYEAYEYEVSMVDALDDANVEDVWNNKELSCTGEGTVIAILDTGVNYYHRDMMLDEDEINTKYTEQEWKEKIKLLGYGAYKTSKVPFAYDYGNEKNDCLMDEGNFISDLFSSNDHGYHVAGISAANGVIKGVAKDAQVLGMKVLGAGETVSTSDRIVRAIEDAVKLGADVINMSLGSSCVPVSDDDYVQYIVNEAAKAGVVCCISAGNSGNFGSKLGRETNEYNIKDTATIASPAQALSAITVAASTNTKDDETVQMAEFSSWGTTNELDIKPEITAPGKDIKSITSEVEKYAVYSGTSMASPYLAGCSALVKESIVRQNLNLSTEEINNYVKATLMNTAKVIYEKENTDNSKESSEIEETGMNDNKNPYSVRYQGAGLVDVEAAIKNKVLVTCNGVPKVELREIKNKDNISFDIKLRNYGDKNVTYVLKEAQIYTDYTDNTSEKIEEHKYGIKPVEGAKITFDVNKVEVVAGGENTIKAKVILGENFEIDHYVEAYIKLDSTESVSVGMPVLGFYGDWSKESILDTPVYEGESLIGAKKSTSLVDTCENASAYIYGKNVIKIENTQEKTLESTGSIEEVTENISVEELNEVFNSKELNSVNLDKEAKEKLKEYISGLKTTVNCYPFIKANKDYKIKKIVKNMSFAIAKIKEDGYVRFKFDAPYTEIGMMYMNFSQNNFGTQEYKKQIIDTDSFDMKVTKGDIIIISISKLGYEKGDKFGTLRMDYVTDSKIIEYKEIYDGDKSAFSPNNDGISDKVYPVAINLRSSADTDIYVLDSNKNKIRTLGSNIMTGKYKKSVTSDVLYGQYTPFTHNINIYDYVVWDGMIYNTTTNKYEYAKEGQYYIQIDSRVRKNHMPQSVVMPIKIDFQKPTIEEFEVGKIDGNTVVTFKPKDNVDLSSYFYIDIQREGKNKHMTLSSLYADNLKDENGQYFINLGDIGDGQVTIMVEDMAGNSTISSTLDNTDNIDFSTREKSFVDKLNILIEVLDDSKEEEIFKTKLINKTDLNKDGTYTLKGKLSSEYDKIMINDIEATLNKESNEYEINIPLTLGTNVMTIKKYKDNCEKDTVDETKEMVYLEDMSLEIKDAKLVENKDKELVETIKISKDTVDVQGIIRSYFNVSKIVINGDVIYSSNARTAVNNTECLNECKFSYELKKEDKGTVLYIEVYNVQGHKLKRYLEII